MNSVRSFILPAALVIALVAVFATSGCGYAFRSPVPDHLQTVYVPTFENDTREFLITQQLTESVINEFLNESRLRLVAAEEDADLLVSGRITQYEEEALSYDPGQEATADVFERRIVLSVTVRIEDRVRERTLWENNRLRHWGEFNENEGETRETGIERAIEKIAEEVLRHVAEEF